MRISDPDLEWDIERAMGSDVNILVTGGDIATRRAVAERIHRGSAREGQPFRVVELARDDHVEPSWLAGAVGTVFIEEVSALSATHQATLLHALDEWTRSAERVRASRFITASAHRVYEEVVGGRFRHDLFYRLNEIHIILPGDLEAARV